MTDEELAAIEARHTEAVETLKWEGGIPGMGDVVASVGDIPALIAEVRRLRAMHQVEAFMESREDWRLVAASDLGDLC